MTTLRAEPLTAAAFRRYGRVIEMPRDDAQARGPGWRWWAEIALLEGDGRRWGVGYLDLEPAVPRFDWAERHLRSAEAVIATSADVLVYVGAPGDDGGLPALRDFRVFVVPAGDGVVLDPGVWHGAPLAVRRPTSALVLLLEHTGRDDVTVERFDTPVDVEVPS
ncbi:MAG TPA: ureidoglycolate lyase [Actinomycetota bacterium]|nr:ureidoglycolate lyase [Actinomycetota bacterium]